MKHLKIVLPLYASILKLNLEGQVSRNRGAATRIRWPTVTEQVCLSSTRVTYWIYLH